MSAAPAPQTLGPEEYEQEVEAHEGRMAGAGEARGFMREQTGALAQAMGDEGDGGSVGGGGARTIDDTDDFTALLMNTTRYEADQMLANQRRTVACLNREIDAMENDYNNLAMAIEKACGGRRMSEEALLAVKDKAGAPAKAQQDSISLAVLARSLAKRRAIVGRKERLCQTLALFIQEDQGVLRSAYTTAYFLALKSKAGGLTAREKEDKIIFGLTDPAAPAAAAAAAAPAAHEPNPYAGGGGGASSSAAKRTREEEEAAQTAARLTASGQPDKRFKAGAK